MSAFCRRWMIEKSKSIVFRSTIFNWYSVTFKYNILHISRLSQLTDTSCEKIISKFYWNFPLLVYYSKALKNLSKSKSKKIGKWKKGSHENWQKKISEWIISLVFCWFVSVCLFVFDLFVCVFWHLLNLVCMYPHKIPFVLN